MAQKIKIAQNVARGCCDGTYAEGALILCSIISGLSAIAWPDHKKNNIDRKRFVEIITRFSPLPHKVSAPLLDQAEKVWSRLGISQKSFYLTASNDLNEKDVEKECPNLSLRKIRKYSYANLLYEQIRCGYVHLYKPGREAADHDSLRPIVNFDKNVVSYININSKDNKICRLIHFPLHWIAGIAEGVARGLDNECTQRRKMPFDDLCLEVPTKWWLDG